MQSNPCLTELMTLMPGTVFIGMIKGLSYWLFLQPTVSACALAVWGSTHATRKPAASAGLTFAPISSKTQGRKSNFHKRYCRFGYFVFIFSLPFNSDFVGS